MEHPRCCHDLPRCGMVHGPMPLGLGALYQGAKDLVATTGSAVVDYTARVACVTFTVAGY